MGFKNKICKLNFFLVPLEDIDNLKTIILDRSTKTIEKAGKTQKNLKKASFIKQIKEIPLVFQAMALKLIVNF